MLVGIFVEPLAIHDTSKDLDVDMHQLLRVWQAKNRYANSRLAGVKVCVNVE